MAGALTEKGACAQKTCKPPVVLSPTQGWLSLYNALNPDGNDSPTAQTLPWSTDIKWLYKE
jgi:hypothetical protein